MEICQSHLPYPPWSDPALSRLPGLKPVEPGEWLQIDDAYQAQMRRRGEILANARDEVLKVAPWAKPALAELLETVLGELASRPDFTVSPTSVTCPDGREVGIGEPLGTLNELVQEDFCLLQKREGDAEHVLSAALLCFPASWSLAQKFLRPLIAIHAPVAQYDDDIARRVQRLFDFIQPGKPMWRANALVYEDPELFQPRREEARRAAPNAPGFLRSERQSLVRLPESNAVVFSIHTYVVALSAFSPEEIAGLETVPAPH